MDDMWMLSVAAELINRGTAPESPALGHLEELVRAVPSLADALDAARTGEDKFRLGEALAEELGFAYEESEPFAERLDAIWPHVLFAPRTPVARHAAPNNVVLGTTGTVFQAGDINGHINIGG